MSTEMTTHNQKDFGEILSIIEKAEKYTLRVVNREMIIRFVQLISRTSGESFLFLDKFREITEDRLPKPFVLTF